MGPITIVLFIDTSYNQPKLSPYAVWNSSAVTFLDNGTVGTEPYGLFVNINNTVYVSERSLQQVQVWLEGNMTPSRSISGGLSWPIAIFATISGDLYVDNGQDNGRVDMWTPNSTISIVSMYVGGVCFGLFVDIYENVYCSFGDGHQVRRKAFYDPPNVSVIVAGNGINGDASYMLNKPRGIFIDTQLNLYVADCLNDRVQFFPPGVKNATTLLGTGASSTFILRCPNSVILDADGHLFVIDYGGKQVVGWGPNGYQCVAACNGGVGPSSDTLSNPYGLYFDSYGNIFVSDTNYNRIQKFLIIINTSGKFSSKTAPDLTHSYHRYLGDMNVLFKTLQPPTRSIRPRSR